MQYQGSATKHVAVDVLLEVIVVVCGVVVCGVVVLVMVCAVDVLVSVMDVYRVVVLPVVVAQWQGQMSATPATLQSRWTQ